MDNKRVKSIVLGAGISGSVISNTLNLPVVDKASMPGGRCSTGRIGNGHYDKGATYLKKEIEYRIDGKIKKFKIQDYLSILKSKIELLPHPTRADLVVPKNGMGSLIHALQKNDLLYCNTLVQKINISDNSIQLISEPGEFITDFLYCTAPLPQTINLLDSHHINPFINTLDLYSKYKKTLIFSAYWNREKSIYLKFNEESKLNPDSFIEYYTIESIKTKQDIGTIISIQFSGEFSEKYFDSWVGFEKKPDRISLELGLSAIKSIFEENGNQYIEPDDIRIHRWKFSAPLKSMFQKDEFLDFDNDELREYLTLCGKERIVILGDWLFGQRVTKCILGSLYLTTLFGNPPKWVEEILRD